MSRRRVDIAAISGDGRRILTVREVGIGEIRDSESSELLGELRPRSPLEGSDAWHHAGPFETFIEAAALNRDGSRAVLGLNDGTAVTCSVPDGARIAILHPPGQPAWRWQVMRAVTFSPDSSLVAAGFCHRDIGVWAEDGRRRIAFLRASRRDAMVTRDGFRNTLVTSIAITANNRWIFAGNGDLSCAVWEIDTGRIVFEAVDHAEQTIAICDQGDRILWATAGGSVWVAPTGESARKVLATGEHWAEVAFRGSELLARTSDGTVTRWRFPGHRTVLFTPAMSFPRRSSERSVWLGFATAERFFHSAGEQRLVIHHQRGVATVDLSRPLEKACFTPDANAVATWGWSNPAQLWSVADGALLRTFGSGAASALAFSPDGKRVAVADSQHSRHPSGACVCLYDVQSGRLDRTLAGHSHVSHACFSRDGKWLATMGAELIIWRLRDFGWFRANPVCERPVRSGISCLRFLPDGRLFVIDQDRAFVFRARHEQVSFSIPFGVGNPWCFSGDGQFLTLSVPRGLVQYDLAGGELVRTVDTAVPHPEWFPDSGFAEREATHVWVALWRTDFGLFAHQYDWPRGGCREITFSEDGLTVLPARQRAIIVTTSDPATVVGSMPFEGWLLASRIVDGVATLVNETGTVFRSSVPRLSSFVSSR